MKRIILCEGKTDAILLSYFLEKWGWTYLKNSKGMPVLPPLSGNEVRNWYCHSEKPKRELAIWGVGGIDNIPTKLATVLDRNRNERDPDNRFGFIVLFFDSDDRTAGECTELVVDWIRKGDIRLTSDLRIGEWASAQLSLAIQPLARYDLELLAVALPPDDRGNLETFLMTAIRRHSPEIGLIVAEAHTFIEKIPDDPYLARRRLRYKACLGTIMSVLSPDWVFGELDTRLRQVRWDDLPAVAAIYNKLEQL